MCNFQFIIYNISMPSQFFSIGPIVFCDGVCEWWRSYVPNTASWKIQRTSCSVRILVYLFIFYIFLPL